MPRRCIPVDESYFSCVDSAEKAYWLGFISADGCILETEFGPILQVSLASTDYSHLVKLKNALSFQGKIYTCQPSRKGKVYGEATIKIGAHGLSEDLIKLGVKPRKSITLIPWYGPDYLMRHYWRGYLDGNGTVSESTKGAWTIGISGPEFVAKRFHEFVRAAGIVGGSCSAMKISPGIWQVQYQGISLPQSVARLLYQDAFTYLDRKMKLVQSLLLIDPIKHAGLVTHNLTPETVEELYGMYHSIPVVAEVLGMNKKTLMTYCCRHGIRIRELAAKLMHGPDAVTTAYDADVDRGVQHYNPGRCTRRGGGVLLRH